MMRKIASNLRPIRSVLSRAKVSGVTGLFRGSLTCAFEIGMRDAVESDPTTESEEACTSDCRTRLERQG